jgi:micrococcal nuclease
MIKTVFTSLKIKLASLALLFLFIGCVEAPKKVPKKFKAEVVSVQDGDTITILFRKNKLRVRFNHIDCPEKGQDFGNKAKQFVYERVNEKEVTVVNKGVFDRYGRLIAVIIDENGVNINKALVKNGLAMHYKKYSKDMEYDELEKIAEKEKVGIWSREDVLPPWEFRANKRKK